MTGFGEPLFKTTVASRIMGGIATTGSLIYALALCFAAYTGHVFFFD